MWVGSMIMEYANYILWGPQSKYEYLFTIQTFRLTLENWVMFYSRHYSQETLFILVLFTENTIHNIIIIENIDIIHTFLTIYTSTIHHSCWHQCLLFSKFLPMKVR